MDGNAWDTMRAALAQARAANAAADNYASQMGDMLRGRLRAVPAYILRDLKRELRDFDMHTKEWKVRP